MFTEELEPNYVPEFREVLEDTSNIFLQGRSVSFMNRGNDVAFIDRLPLYPGEEIIIQTDGLITKNFNIGFPTKTNTIGYQSKEDRIDRVVILYTKKVGYRKVSYPVD
jgi:hypothetical protein